MKNLVISRDGRRLVACLQDGKARVWDLEHRDRKPRDIDLHGPGEVASTLATDSDGRWAVTTGSAPTVHPAGGVPSSIPRDATRRLWDLYDPEIGEHPIILRLPDQLWAYNSFYNQNLVVSDDDKWLASRTNLGLVVWKLDGKPQDPAQPIIAFAKEPAAANIRAFTFNADSKSLWIAGLNVVLGGDLTLSNPLQVPLVLRGHDGPISALKVSRNSRRLITGGADATARLWDLDAPSASADPIEVRVPAKVPGPAGASLKVATDRHVLAFGWSDGSVRVWDLTDADPLRGPTILLGPQPSPSRPDLFLAQDHRWLMAWDKVKAARLWNLSALGQGARVVELGEFEPNTPFLISADSHWMAASVKPRSTAGKSSNSVVRLWELTPDGPPSRPIAVEDEQVAVAFVGQSDKLLTKRGNQFSLWDLRSGLPPSGPTALAGQNPSDPAYRFQVTPDGRRLVLGRSKGGVSVWDLEHPNATPIILSRSETLIKYAVSSFFFTPDSRRVILHLPYPDGRIFLWELDGPGAAGDPVEPPDPETPEERKGDTRSDLKAPTETPVRPKYPLYFPSPDGRWLIDAGKGGIVRLWDLMRPDPFESPALEFPSRESLPLLSSSPFIADGRWLATAEGDKLHLWDLQGEKPTVRAKIHLQPHDPVRPLSVDSTGQWVALAGSDNQLHLWELTPDGPFERTILQPAPGSNLQPAPRWNPWNELFLSPGGKRAAAISYDPVARDSVARVYRVPLAELREAARQAVGRNLSRREWERFFPGQDYHKTFDSLPEPPP